MDGMTKREMIDVSELQRLSFACPNCKVELVFKITPGLSVVERCRFCDYKFATDNIGLESLLDKALKAYRLFYENATQIELKLVRDVDVKPGPSPSSGSDVTPTSQKAGPLADPRAC